MATTTRPATPGSAAPATPGSAAPAIATCLSLAPGASLRYTESGAARLSGTFGELTLPEPSAGLREALDALAAEGAEEAELVRLAGPHAVTLFYHLGAAERLQLLCWTVLAGATKLVTLAPRSRQFVRRHVAIDEERPLQLSRFACCRVEDDRWLVEHPLSGAVVIAHDRRVASLLFDIGRPVSLAALSPHLEAPHDTGRPDGADRLDPSATLAVLQVLASAALLSPIAGADADCDQPAADAALRQWEFHDLSFHAASRGAAGAPRAGATYRFAGHIPPLPATKAPLAAPHIDLFRPDIAALRRDDPPFTEVLERRKTLHGRGKQPLSAEQLGELLYRSARVRRLAAGPHDEISDRPCPSAGARHPLELYPLVGECTGLAAGLYHYDPANHRLEHVAGETPDVKSLLAAARVPERSPDTPDVLIVIAARFQRVSWKYETIAYSLILQDTGVLLQTMYLVATAMGLSPCALGRGDADTFCRAASTHPLVEASVAEFALSGPPA